MSNDLCPSIGLKKRSSIFVTAEPTIHIVGATLGWDGSPTLCFEERTPRAFWFIKWTSRRQFVFPRLWEQRRYGAYYPDGFGSWPKDPVTGKKLEIVE